MPKDFGDQTTFLVSHNATKNEIRQLKACYLSPQVVTQEDVTCVTKEAVQDKNAISIKLKASSNCVSKHCSLFIEMLFCRLKKRNNYFLWLKLNQIYQIQIF